MERPAIFNREIPVCAWSVCVTLLACAALVVCLFWQLPSAHAADLSPVQTVQQPAPPSEPQKPLAESSLTTTPAESQGQAETPVALTPAVPVAPLIKPASIAVFPLVQHADRSKAFSDLPVVFSTQMARQLTQTFALSGAPLKVLNPIYSYDSLLSKNYAGTYKRMVDDTLEAGEPRETDIQELVTQLGSPEYPVEWVVITRSTLDLGHSQKPTLKQWPMAFIYDQPPADPNWFIDGQVQLYHVSPGLPLVWSGKTKGHVTWSAMGPISSTIMGNSTSLHSFQTATAGMAKTLAKQFPKAIYLAPQATVHAKLAGSPLEAMPTTAPTQPAPVVIYPEEQSLLKRILQR